VWGGAMKILVGEITESPKTVSFAEGVDELNKVYTAREYHEFRFPSSVDVRVVFYRSGQEILLAGFLHGVVEAGCSRCLEVYEFPVEKKFEIALAPDLAATNRKKELNKEELGLSFYQGAEIDLTPLIREQILLSRALRRLRGQLEQRSLSLCLASSGRTIGSFPLVKSESLVALRLLLVRRAFYPEKNLDIK
jgi:uncharacterized metal-binding protein YceD (DUF177 family)